MSTLDELLKKHRRRVIDREELAFRELLLVYQDLERELRRQYAEIQKVITDAAAAGEEISGTWIAKSRRLASLLSQVEEQVVRFGGSVSRIVSREQEQALVIAVEQTRETVELLTRGQGARVPTPGLGSTLPPRVVENAVGMMGDGSPIYAYFEKNMAPAVAAALRKELITAAATGTDFKTIARRLRQAGDITRSRALAMARTEVNRVRRETTRQIYRENSDVIEGWEWVASKSQRTCPVCLAMDGSIHKLDEPFPQHINCRCTMVPVIIGSPRPKRTIGADWLASQPDEIQDEVLGKAAGEAYRDGSVDLRDFVGWRNSEEFGRSVYTRPLAAVLAGK